MAERKRRASRAKPLVVNGENRNDKLLLTGIYRESLTWGYATISTLENSLAAIHQTAIAAKTQAQSELRELPDEYVDVGELRYSKKQEHPAWVMLCTADTALRCIDEMQKALATGDAKAAAAVGIALGQAAEKMRVLQHEHLALIGLRHSRRNAEIAKSRELSDEQLRPRWQAVQDELAEQARRGERVSRERAYQAAADRLNLSKESVKKAFLAIDRVG